MKNFTRSIKLVLVDSCRLQNKQMQITKYKVTNAREKIIDQTKN